MHLFLMEDSEVDGMDSEAARDEYIAGMEAVGFVIDGAEGHSGLDS